MRMRAPSPLCPCLAALLFSPSPLLAQDALELPDINVSTVKKVELAPTATQTDRETLERRFIRDFSDLGRRAEPGVNFNRNNESINIRGLDRNRVLTTIDGIRVPWITDGARSRGPTGGAQGGLDSIDFSGLSRLDIVRGADSSKAGSGALGGALQLYTLDPEDLLRDDRNVGALAKTDYDSADDSWGLNAALAGRYNNTTWLLQGGGRLGHELENGADHGGYGVERSRANPADSDQHSLLIKVRQQLNDEHRIGITGESFNRSRDVETRTAQGSTYLIGHNDTDERIRRQRLSIDHRFIANSDWSLIDYADTVLYWQQIVRNDDQDAIRAEDSRAAIPDRVFQMFGLAGNPYKYPSGPFKRENRIEKTMYGLASNAGKRIELDGLSHSFEFGGEAYWMDAEQSSKGLDNCPPNGATIPVGHPLYMGPTACQFLHTNQADMPRVEGYQWALYASDRISFLDDRVTLTPSLRYDHYKQSPKVSGRYRQNANPETQGSMRSSSDHKLSASLLATWQAHEQVMLYAQWAQGFRAPDATELYMNYGAPGSYLVLGNADLKPEESHGWEIGGKLGNDELGGSLAFFDNRYKNFIDDDIALSTQEIIDLGLDPAEYSMGVTRTDNRAKVRIYGAEGTAHWQLMPNWKLWGSLSWAVGKDRNTHQHLSSIAPLTGIVGVSYSQEHYGADLSMTAARARTRVENAGDYKAPGYGVVDLTGYWRPVGLDNLTLQAGLFNLFDKTYWNALNVPTGNLTQPDAYYSEPGRSFRVAATYQF